MKKALALGTLLSGALLVGCSSSSASISPQERLAVHFGARGEMHQALDTLRGEFEAVSYYWPRMGASARVSMGHMSGSWDESQLAMSCEYQGDLLGSPAELTSALTWDDIRGCYVGMWTRTSGETVLTLCDGHADPEGDIVSMRCEDGATVREVLKIESADHHVREVYRTLDSGEEYLSWRLEMVRISD